MKIPSYYQLPTLPDAGLLQRYLSSMGVVVPLARTNLVTNPLLKYASTGWTGLTDSSFTSGFAGPYIYDGYGASVQPTAANARFGLYYSISLTSGTTYAVSVMFKRVGRLDPNAVYALAVTTTGNVDLIVARFQATNYWQWLSLIWTETSTTTRRIAIRRDNTGAIETGATTDLFRISGLQVESCADGVLEPTTYIDGDQQGLIPNQFPIPYGWNGAPHASTSYRSGQTRAGGRIMRLKDFGFLLSAIIGLGMAPPTQEALTFAQLDGGQYQTTIKPPRTFSMVGRWAATDPTNLDIGMANLARLLDRDAVGLRQPLVLTNQSRLDTPGEPVSIQALYQGGLEGNVVDLPTAQTPITFTQLLPYVGGPDQGTELSEQSSVSNANYILQRAANGAWGALGTGGSGGSVFAVATGLDGSLYAGGAFTSMGGVANTSRIAVWNGTAWAALGTGAAGGNVYALAVGVDGRIYAAGDFTSMGGVANTSRIAVWNGSAWAALTTGLNGTALALLTALNGDIIVGGNFTLAGGVANTVRIARWDGSAWTALNTGLGAQVASLAKDAAGNIYAGGDFVDAGGVTEADRIAYWDGTAWNAMFGGTNSTVMAIAVAPNGIVYAGGDFTAAGGVTVGRIAAWNGISWQPLGVGVSSPNSVTALAIRADGMLIVAGTFTTAGGYAIPDAIAYWNGTTWVFADVNLPGTASVLAVNTTPDGKMTIGYSTNGTAVAAGITSPVINAGTGVIYPRLTIRGPSSGSSRIYQLINTTTGAAIYFNYTILAGETAVLTLDPTNITFVSTFQGNILHTILPGSDTTGFLLQPTPDPLDPAGVYPGANTISFYAESSTVSAALDWQELFVSVTDALYRSI